MNDIQGILKCIPHRYPFLLVDRVVEIELGKSIHALKNVSVNEPFFQGHFPGLPVMPGVLIVEALAQAGAILAIRTTGDCIESKLLLFRSIERAKFRKTVVPGDQVHLHAEVLRRRQNLWTLRAEARVDGEVVTEADLGAALVDREA